jgi:uncharacterized membrane protein YeaQ/YmgE (transglycosylase-associated protein family)
VSPIQAPNTAARPEENDDGEGKEGHIMAEQIAQMVPMLILAGLMAGFTAQSVTHAGGYGLISDMVAGLIGSALLGGLIWIVVYREPGMLGMFAIGCAGAGLAVLAQRTLWRSPRHGT